MKVMTIYLMYENPDAGNRVGEKIGLATDLESAKHYLSNYYGQKDGQVTSIGKGANDFDCFTVTGMEDIVFGLVETPVYDKK